MQQWGSDNVINQANRKTDWGSVQREVLTHIELGFVELGDNIGLFQQC